MYRKRPCRICGRWFRPHPRAGDRQRVCGAGECQRERHRRACKAWHEREHEAERCHRLRQRLRRSEPEPATGRHVVRWDVVRDAVGLQLAVILEESYRLLEDVVRDAVRRQGAGMQGESGQVLAGARRDGMV